MMLPWPASIPSVLGLQRAAWVPWESLTSLHPMQQLFPQPPGPLPSPQQSYMASSTLGGCASLSSQQPPPVPAGPGNPDTHPSMLGFLSDLG